MVLENYGGYCTHIESLAPTDSNWKNAQNSRKFESNDKYISSSLCINLPQYLGSTSEAKSRIPARISGSRKNNLPSLLTIIFFQEFSL